ncbi:Peroxisomal membrane protein PMP27 [Orbilia oligospora]|nr:Peroxisomal membrane protein PMP27 [Orbilia oligospora]KAF3242921.1 Peroxisomal membrane protein PMP27 [Orbilia oligospora]KAF3260367.1 Peroxisomal membrane protein PMP27 [Orbilia oligospora]KAF3278695.1 Peroxisomal membrane protein PMP27 [Orbilia oligospora]
MDQQTPPRTPVLEGSTSDDEIKKHQTDGITITGLGIIGSGHVLAPSKNLELSASIKAIVNSEAAAMASAGQLVFPKAVLYGRTINRVIKLLQSANGLDKIIRTIQYTSRLIAHMMLLGNLHTPTTSTAAAGIRRQFGLTRRLLRCFNNIGQINVTINLIREGRQRINNDFMGYILELIEGLGYTGFGIADSLGYLPEAGIMGIPYKGVVDKLALHFWLYALVASIVGGLVKVMRLRRRLGRYNSIFPTVEQATIESTSHQVELINEKENEKVQILQKMQELPPTPPDSPIPATQVSVNDAALSVVKGLEEQQFNTGLNVIGNAADIIFPLAALKVKGFSAFSDGVMGFAGCISSAVGMRKAWKATA